MVRRTGESRRSSRKHGRCLELPNVTLKWRLQINYNGSMGSGRFTGLDRSYNYNKMALDPFHRITHTGRAERKPIE